MILTSKQTPKIDKEHHKSQLLSSASPLRHKQAQIPCHNCQRHGNLICYACCYQVACEFCYSSQHFVHCERQFNKHIVSLGTQIIEEGKGKRNGKHNKNHQKCKRCEKVTDCIEQCLQCKSQMCKECSDVIHSKGKFVKHFRTVSQSPEKLKRIQTLTTQNVEEDVSFTKEKKQHFENYEYGFKARDKNSKSSAMTQSKKGKSIMKTPFQNQENTPMRHRRKNSMCTSETERRSNIKQKPSNAHIQPWIKCARHSKVRSILTQGFDLLCSQCYQQIKNNVVKLKNIELDTWMNNEMEKNNTCNYVSGIAGYADIKKNELSLEFEKHRKEIQSQYKQKKKILDQRYENNLMTLQKWYNSYASSLKNLNEKCQVFNQVKESLETGKEDQLSVQKQLTKVNRLQSLLLYEQIVKLKKQYVVLQDTYQFRITELTSQQFQDLLKNFSFVRKKIQSQSVGNPQKNKMTQSAYLRQSRFSNSSITTDRKLNKRDESMIKSSYYEISHSNKFTKRSQSKDLKEELTKDISQKVLFPASNSDRKDITKQGEAKLNSLRQKNSYFFDNPPATNEKSHKKQKDRKQQVQIIDLGFKDVKYINLQTVITQKLDKPDKKDLTSSSVILIENIKTTMTNDISEESSFCHNDKSQPALLSNARMIESINVAQEPTRVTAQERGSMPVGSSSNIQNAKNKRKSDYMEIRDRLRKPSIMTKICK